jgi:GGDEF domain-containing protein
METTVAPSAPAALNPGSRDESEAWRKLTAMALEAVAKSPVEFSADERSAFSSRFRDSMAVLDDQAGASQILITAGSLAQAIVQYNEQAQRHFDGLIAQFRELTRFLIERCALPVGLQQNIESALALQELPALEGKLAECLDNARKTPAVARGPEAPSGSSDSTPSAATDTCTGLPTRHEAEAAIKRAMSSDTQSYVASFYVHRLNLINARFGDAIGNQVILFCSQHIATNLAGAKDTLFRWRGPGFVALLERNESPLAIASEVQRFTAMPLSRFFETPSRTVYLPIKLTAEVLPTAGKSFEEVIDQLQKSLHAFGADG